MIYQSCQNKNVDIPAFVGYNEIKGGVLMIYSIYEIQQRIAPVAKQYGVKAVFLFGSYARGDYTENSDIDIVAVVHGSRMELQQKLKEVWDRSAEVGLENDIVVSPTVIPYDEFKKYQDTLPYYRNIMQEGKKIG